MFILYYVTTIVLLFLYYVAVYFSLGTIIKLCFIWFNYYTMFLLGKLLYTIHIYFGTIIRLLLDNNKIKMARKLEKILKENAVG